MDEALVREVEADPSLEANLRHLLEAARGAEWPGWAFTNRM